MIPTVGANPPADFEHLGDVLFVLRLVVQLELHHLLQFLGLGAVDRQHQGLFQERIADLFHFAVERDDAFLAGLLGVAHDLADLRVRILALVEKHRAQASEGRSTTGRGNWIITAPSVPPKTIMAAVGCMICATLPPSSVSPSRMPPIATTTPPKLLLSMPC